MTLANGSIADVDWTLPPETLEAQLTADAKAMEEAAQDPALATPVEIDPAAQSALTAPQLSEVELIAADLGWTPKDQWRGDPTKHVDAATFLRNTKQVVERAKVEARRTKSEAQVLADRLARVEGQTQIISAQQRQAEAERFQAWDEEVEIARLEAYKAGNQERYQQLTDMQRKGRSDYAAFERSTQPAAPQVNVEAHADRLLNDPIARRFFTGPERWVVQDEEAWEVMERAMDHVAARGGTPAQQFRAAQEELRFAFPEMYESRPAQAAPSNYRAQQAQQPAAERPRDPVTGQFVAQSAAPQQFRRAPPALGDGMARSSAPADPAASLTPDQRAAADDGIKKGLFKDHAEFIAIMNGEITSVR